MKLVRYGDPRHELPGMIDKDGVLRDLTAQVDDVDHHALGSEALDLIRGVPVTELPIVDGTPRLGPCVGTVGKFLCIGLNYRDHAEEAGMAIPDHPILFLKGNSAIAGANDGIVIPRGARAVDWEVELGVVIGDPAKYVSEGDALRHVAGYCIVNDVSERDWQLKLSGQWTKGKSCDGFGPIGPWMVTADEIPDPQDLNLWLDVNGTRRQTGHTSTMIFTVAQIISHLSQFMTLHTGDIIATGTPPGVGMGMTPDPVYLKPGDVVELGIDGLGTQRQEVTADA